MMLSEKKTGLTSICNAIRKNRSLSTLIMKNNQLNTDNCMHIAYALHQNRYITELDLQFNKIAAQWFLKDTFLKTKLLAKMPTIRYALLFLLPFSLLPYVYLLR